MALDGKLFGLIGYCCVSSAGVCSFVQNTEKGGKCVYVDLLAHSEPISLICC